MYFEVAGITVNPIIPPLVGFCISLFMSMGGVSGGFLILPFQMSVLGFTSPAVSPTNQLYNIIAIPSGVWRYIKEGRMVWPLTWIVIIGTLPGVFIGAYIRIKYLYNPTSFKVFAGFVLLYIGLRLLIDIIKKKTGSNIQSEEKFQELAKNYHMHKQDIAGNKRILPRIIVRQFNLKKISYDFFGESFTVPTKKIALISFLVGIVGGAYGIGGGAFIAPIFVAFLSLPVYTVAGAALMGTFLTSLAGVIFYWFLSFYFPNLHVRPDILLGFLFGIGGFAGMYLGARLQKYMPAKIIKWILGLGIMFLALKYIYEMFRWF